MLDDLDTKREFAAAVTLTLCGIYGKPKPERDMLAMWFSVLRPYSLDDIRQAFSRHVGDTDRGQFPPRPADIVRIIDGSASGAAPLAWGKVIRAAQQVGAYSSVTFDDPAIHAAISDLGGWPEICRTEADELPFVQRRFEASYRAHRERGGFEFPPRLPGIHAINNAARGYGDETRSVLIGDPEQCKEVLRLGTSSGLRITQEARGLRPVNAAAVLSLVPPPREDAA